jgi:hypothetical protein
MFTEEQLIKHKYLLRRGLSESGIKIYDAKNNTSYFEEVMHYIVWGKDDFYFQCDVIETLRALLVEEGK